MTKSNDDYSALLRVGLAWFYDTEQPVGALIQHHGSRVIVGDRTIKFIPSTRSGPAVVISVTHPHFTDYRLDNPLVPGEMAAWSERLSALGYPVIDSWNGDGFESGSLAIGVPVHDSLQAAERLYHAGCPAHLGKSVFCGCGWYQRGNRLMVMPDFKEVTADA